MGFYEEQKNLKSEKNVNLFSIPGGKKTVEGSVKHLPKIVGVRKRNKLIVT